MTREQHLIAAWLGLEARRVKLHEVTIQATPERAYKAVLDLPLAELPLTRMLFRLRGIRHRRDTTVRELFTNEPFRLLDEQAPKEIVFEIWRGRFRAIGHFRFDARGLDVRVTTATWVETWGWPARVAFEIYWLFVAPFSGLIRRELLRVAQRRASALRIR